MLYEYSQSDFLRSVCSEGLRGDPISVLLQLDKVLQAYCLGRERLPRIRQVVNHH